MAALFRSFMISGRVSTEPTLSKTKASIAFSSCMSPNASVNRAITPLKHPVDAILNGRSRHPQRSGMPAQICRSMRDLKLLKVTCAPAKARAGGLHDMSGGHRWQDKGGRAVRGRSSNMQPPLLYSIRADKSDPMHRQDLRRSCMSLIVSTKLASPFHVKEQP